MKTATQVKLGTAVTYTNDAGHQKLALVAATPETLTEGSEHPLEAGQAHLFVIGISGIHYMRYAIPMGRRAGSRRAVLAVSRMTVELDEAIFDLLTREKRQDETYNDVLRRLLGLDDEGVQSAE